MTGDTGLGGGSWSAGWHGWLATVVVAGVVGYLTVAHRKIGLALAALVLVFGVLVADPLLVVVMALPGVLLVQRLGGAAPTSVRADVLVFLGGWLPVPRSMGSGTQSPAVSPWRALVPGDSGPGGDRTPQPVQHRRVVSPVLLPGRQRIVWLGHRHLRANPAGVPPVPRWVLRAGRDRHGVRHRASTSNRPSGASTRRTASAPSCGWPSWSPRSTRPGPASAGSWPGSTKYLCVAGLLASQSRQSGSCWSSRWAWPFLLNPDSEAPIEAHHARRGTSRALLYSASPLSARNNPKFNSVSIRFGQIGAAIHVWHLSPIFGEGMRFYNLPQWVSVTAPPNVVIDNLASTGHHRLAGLRFPGLRDGADHVSIAVRPRNARPGVLVGHYVDGLFDIFWIGGPRSRPTSSAVCHWGWLTSTR